MGLFTRKPKIDVNDIKGKDDDKLERALQRLQVTKKEVHETECLIREYMTEFRAQIRRG